MGYKFVIQLFRRDLAQIPYVYTSLANKTAKVWQARPILPSLRKTRKTELAASQILPNPCPVSNQPLLPQGHYYLRGCVYIYVYLDICVEHIHLHICVYTWICVYVNASMHTHMHIHNTFLIHAREFRGNSELPGTGWENLKKVKIDLIIQLK